MDLTVLSDDLARELALCRKLTDGKLPLEVLSSVLLRAEAGRAHLTATNTISGLRTSCVAQVDAPGVALVPARTLDEIARRLPGAQLRVTSKSDGTPGLNVSGGGFRAMLQTQPTEDYPDVAASGDSGFPLPAPALRQALRLVRFAADGTDAKLQGILLELRPPDGQAAAEMRLVATDAHRLALARSACAHGSEKHGAFLPRQAVDLLSYLLDGAEGTVDYRPGETHLFFTSGGRQLVSRALEAQFPAYERILKSAPRDRHLEVGRSLLQDAMRRAAITLGSLSEAMRLTCRKDGLVVEAKSAKVGHASETVAAAYDGPDLTVALNSGYVLDVLDAAGTEKVALDLKDGSSAVTMSAVGGMDYRCVVMPVNPSAVQ